MSVSQYDAQLQPLAILVAISIGKPTMGNTSQSAIKTKVITPGVTLVTLLMQQFPSIWLVNQLSWISTQDATQHASDCPKSTAASPPHWHKHPLPCTRCIGHPSPSSPCQSLKHPQESYNTVRLFATFISLTAMGAYVATFFYLHKHCIFFAIFFWLS